MKKLIVLLFILFSFSIVKGNFVIDPISNICYISTSNENILEIPSDTLVAQLSQGRQIKFLRGTYRIIGNLILPENSVITGEPNLSEVIFDNNNQIIIENENITISNLIISANFTYIYDYFIVKIKAGTKNLLIKDCFIGNLGSDSLGIYRPNQYAIKIEIKKVYNFKISNCRIANITNAGADSTRNFGFCGGIFFGTKDTIIESTETSYGIVDNCTFENIYTRALGPYSIHIEKDADAIRFYNDNENENLIWDIKFIKNTFKSVQKRAFKLQNCSGIQIDGVNIIADRTETRMEEGIRVYDCKYTKIQNVFATGNINRLINNYGLSYSFINNVSYEWNPDIDLFGNGCQVVIYHPASFSFYENISVRGFSTFIYGNCSNTKFTNLNAKFRLYNEEGIYSETKYLIKMQNKCKNNIFDNLLIHEYNNAPDSTWLNIIIGNADGTKFKECDFKNTNNLSGVSFITVENSSNISFNNIHYSGKEKFISYPNYNAAKEKNVYFSNLYLTFEDSLNLSGNPYVFFMRNIDNLLLTNINIIFSNNDNYPMFPVTIHHCDFDLNYLNVKYLNPLPLLTSNYVLLVGYESQGTITSLQTNKTNGIEFYSLAQDHKVVISNKVIVPEGLRETYMHPNCEGKVEYVTLYFTNGTVCNGECIY